MLGGGQLGRMFTHAAQQLGYHVAVFEPEPNCPAAQSADRHFFAKQADEELDTVIHDFATLCDVVTLEFENVDAEIVRKAGRFTLTHPSPDFLEICQNRVKEKSSLADAGFPVTPFIPVSGAKEVKAAASELGLPMVLKTATSGYDGKGQILVRTKDQIESAWSELQTDKAVAEKWIDFDSEVSMVTARNLRREVVSYPLFENSHADHILDVTRCPASNHLAELENEAKKICRGIAEDFGVIGLFCVEFFVTVDGELLINEIAPRPHNSGHLTIEAFNCSQFEQHVRAVCNLPLVKPMLLRPAAMANLLGDVFLGEQQDWTKVLACTEAHLHLYGKSEPREGRKMGHITVLDDSSSEAAITARELRDSIREDDF